MADYLIVDANNIVTRCYQVRAHNASEEPPPREIARTAKAMVDKQFAAMHLEADYVEVAFDAGDSHRKAAFAGYKADRAAHPPGLDNAIDEFDTLCSRAGYACVVKRGWEADDLIATMVRRVRRHGHGVAIYSNDRDLLQLLGAGVIVIQPLGKGEIREWTRESFEAEYGFPPDQYPHYKALTGDASDCLPGVPKLGVVWGKRLIAAHGGIDALYESLARQPPETLSVLQKNILACEDQVRLNLILSTLQEVPGQ